MRYLWSLLVGLVLVSPVFGQNEDGKFWEHKTQQFEVLSFDRNDTVFLAPRVVAWKEFFYKRWGLHDIDLNRPCMIVVAETQQKFKDTFHKDSAIPDRKVSKRFNSSGQEYDQPVYMIAIASDGNWHRFVLPEKISQTCLMNYEDTFNLKFPPWLYFGMSALSNDTEYLRGLFSRGPFNYSSRQLFSESRENVLKMSPEEQQKFIRASAAACLMLRRGFGQQKFLNMLSQLTSETDPQQVLNSVYGYRDYSNFDYAFQAFAQNLAWDINTNKTPRMGLTWLPIQPIAE